MVALGVIFTVLVGLLGALGTSVRGQLLGRQRDGATAIADEVLEQARGRAYAEVGHDLDDDSTLAADSAITGSSPNYSYGGELLAPSSINSAHNAPFTPHRWTTTRDATPYTVNVYITQIIPTAGAGDPYKRLTVKVAWGNVQFASSAVASSVVESTFLYNAVKPPNPWLDGLIDADAGALTVTGSLDNVDLVDSHIWMPYSHAEVHSRDIQTAKGYAGTVRSQIHLNSGTVTGCSLSNANETADCPGQKAVSLSDNDEGTTPPEYDQQAVTDASHTVAAGTGLSAVFGGSNSALSESAARSGSTSPLCAGIFGNDSLPYQCADASGPASVNYGFTAGPVSGALLSGSATARATATVDRTDVPAASRLAAIGTTSVPALDVLTLTGGPSGYAGAVRVGAASATATANSGSGVSGPSVTGSNFIVQAWDTSGSPGYRSFTITPGVASSNTATALLSVGGATVSMTTTITSRDKVLSSATDATGAVTRAEATMASWLDISVHFVVTSGSTTHADLTIDLDYGRLEAQSGYQLN